MVLALVLISSAYIIGSLPFGYWLAKAKGIDITKLGSGSTGATNVYRCVGKKEGILVMVLDFFKGYIPVLVAMHFDQGQQASGWTLFGLPHLVPVVVATISLVGHSKSIFLGFKGGKSAATGLGTMVAFCPLLLPLTFGAFLTIVFTTRIVSLASLVAAFVNVIFMWWLKNPEAYVIYAVIGCVYVWARHVSNIKRLVAGTEPRITLGKKTSATTESPASSASPAGPEATAVTSESEQ